MSANMSTSSPSTSVVRATEQERVCPGAPRRPRAVSRTPATTTTIVGASARQLFADDMESTCLRERVCPGAPVRPAARARLNRDQHTSAQRVLEFGGADTTSAPRTPRRRAAPECPGAPARLRRMHRDLQDSVRADLFP